MKGSKHSNLYHLDHTALVVMDLQPRLLTALSGVESLISANTILLRSSRILGLITIFTEQVPSKLGHTEPSLLKTQTKPMVFEKDSFSAFGPLVFRDKLKALKIKKLVLSGIETPICVYQTAMDALCLGYEVTVLSDCVGCRIDLDGRQCLNQMMMNGVEVIPLETFLFRVLETSANIHFREISNLIKRRN